MNVTQLLTQVYQRYCDIISSFTSLTIRKEKSSKSDQALEQVAQVELPSLEVCKKHLEIAPRDEVL